MSPSAQGEELRAIRVSGSSSFGVEARRAAASSGTRQQLFAVPRGEYRGGPLTDVVIPAALHKCSRDVSGLRMQRFKFIYRDVLPVLRKRRVSWRESRPVPAPGVRLHPSERRLIAESEAGSATGCDLKVNLQFAPNHPNWW
jgi:hypothetical protein